MFQKNKKLSLVIVLLFALMLSAFDSVDGTNLASAFEGEGDAMQLQSDGDADTEEDPYCSAESDKEHAGLSRLARVHELDYETVQTWYCDSGNDVGVIKQVLDYVAEQDEDDPDATLYTIEDILALLEAADGDWDAVKAELNGSEDGEEEDAIDGLEDVEDEGEDIVRGYYCEEGTEREHPSLVNVAEEYELDYAAVQEWFCAGGHGVGTIKSALKAGLEGDLSAEDLFTMYEEYGNWGQVKKALKEAASEDAAPGKSGEAPGKNEDKDKGKPEDKGKPDDKGKGSKKDG